MIKDVLIKALDHFGRGIAHLDGKVVFIKNALPEEVVDIKIIKEKKSFSEAEVLNYKKVSNKRIESICPYYPKCGGCQFLSLSYNETLDFKKNKARDLLNKNKLNYKGKIEIISNKSPLFYRNKISLKIVDGKLGYYEDDTHNLIPIKTCFIAKKPINKIIENINLLNLKNGTLTIRCNTNDEVLLIIDTLEKEYNIELERLKNIIKLVGIVYNNKTIYGDNFFYERIHNMLFSVSFNSFFQVNHNITEELFKLIEENIKAEEKVLDLYSGVGTLGIVASKKAGEVLSVEIIPNAVKNGIKNAKLNKVDNIKFLLGDVSNTINKIETKIDTLIVDPPRVGLDKNTIDFIRNRNIPKIIYVSCDMLTLMRDLKALEDLYEIKEYKLLDMFSYSYHVENFVVLNKINR